MGLEVYTNLTSPLRRYIDLMIQRQIRCLSLGQSPYYSEEEMSVQLTAVEIALRKAYQIQLRRKRYWLLKYLEGKIGQKEDAVVITKRKNNYFLVANTSVLQESAFFLLHPTLASRNILRHNTDNFKQYWKIYLAARNRTTQSRCWYRDGRPPTHGRWDRYGLFRRGKFDPTTKFKPVL